MRAQLHMFVVALIAAGSVQPATAQGGDAENGKDLFKICRPCHQVGPDGRNGIGPTLNGTVGSKAGSVARFVYSDPNRQAGVNGLVWTDDKLVAFLENPATSMPGNKMIYAGMKDATDPRDLIAYLMQ